MLRVLLHSPVRQLLQLNQGYGNYEKELKALLLSLQMTSSTKSCVMRELPCTLGKRAFGSVEMTRIVQYPTIAPIPLTILATAVHHLGCVNEELLLAIVLE
ncbi:hypothetical protein GCK32_006059 [Trichostrongylus colubriformis]|uniref:Uncharacterized protein n=1 Tax=Trichostrongylus colubriformis TaxID=6319 RepID=A0AAN8FS10_TRICO